MRKVRWNDGLRIAAQPSLKYFAIRVEIARAHANSLEGNVAALSAIDLATAVFASSSTVAQSMD